MSELVLIFTQIQMINTKAESQLQRVIGRKYHCHIGSKPQTSYT